MEASEALTFLSRHFHLPNSVQPGYHILTRLLNGVASPAIVPRPIIAMLMLCARPKLPAAARSAVWSAGGQAPSSRHRLLAIELRSQEPRSLSSNAVTLHRWLRAAGAGIFATPLNERSRDVPQNSWERVALQV
jgi:hypothetical protein